MDLLVISGGLGASCLVGDDADCYTAGQFICNSAAGTTCQQPGEAGEPCSEQGDCAVVDCTCPLYCLLLCFNRIRRKSSF